MKRSGAEAGSRGKRFKRFRSKAPADPLREKARAEALDEAALAQSRPIRPVGGATILDDPALGVEQRMLLGTDGTVVRFLEGCFDEPICTAKLEQVSTPPFPTDAELELTGGETILRRKTLLRGARTGHNYVYAEASVVLERVEPKLREALLSTSEPIGRLLVANRVETFRELVRAGWMPAGPLGEHFGLESSDELLSRTYRIITGGCPAMLITEHFPARFSPASEDGPVIAGALEHGGPPPRFSPASGGGQPEPALAAEKDS